jgi:putative colanic acid biosynthesis UDP-glucose lipid carrier transferase
MGSRYNFFLGLVNLLTDILLVNFSYLVSFYLLKDNIPLHWEKGFGEALLVFNLIWLFSSLLMRLYWQEDHTIEDIFRRTWRSLLCQCILFMAFLFFSKSFVSHRFFLLCFLLLGVLFVISRFIFTYFTEFMLKRKPTGKQIAIVGYNPTGKKLADYFHGQKGYYILHGFFDDEISKNISSQRPHDKIVGPIDNCINYVMENKVEEIYSTILPDQNKKLETLIKTADDHCIRVKFVPDFSMHLKDRFYISYVQDFPIITLRKEPLDGIDNRFKKRLFDLIVSSLVIIFILSWLTPLLALFIKLDSRGPIFFKQKRSGRDNAPFWCLKFRSMAVNNKSDEIQATKNDMRITRIGAFMRKNSLDELPQFFNVFVGDMSIAGPRPHMLKHTQQYSPIIEKYMVRHLIKPGITGWAQVNGYRGETETSGLMKKRVEHDLWYLENWSLMLDVKIFFMTIINLFKGEEKAY